MSFDYDKISAKEHEHGSWWTSYADLFMMLSIVFLLMYVASSLRSGSAGFQQQQEYKQLAKRAEDLEQQIKVYNTLKDQQLKESNEEEQKVYENLMARLSLLQDEAKSEKIALRKKALENEQKEQALNEYQRLIRNIINTNVLAKSQIHHRDQVIVSKDATIEEKKQQIAQMEQVVARNEAQIQKINSELDSRIRQLQHEQKRAKFSKAALNRRIAELRKQSAEQVRALEDKNKSIDQELGAVRSTLAQTESTLAQTTTELKQTQTQLGDAESEKAALAAKLTAEKGRYLAEMDALKGQFNSNLANERAAFEKRLKKERLSGSARAKRLAEFARAEERKRQGLEGQLSDLRGKVRDTEAKLSGAQAEMGRALATVENLKKENKEIQGDLERTRAIAEAKKKLAEQISRNFAKSGLKAGVDPGTGEVTIDFGEEYFDTGSSDLKPGMRATLDRFIPVYARSLFNDPKISEKIANVEIIGFASSTYKGKYVNPKSLRPEDKEAIDYNLKLSFARANSIFNHVLNRNGLSREEQEKLMPLMKVVGRGYLPDAKDADRIPSGMSEKQFCEQFNCKKAQRVIVKFNMKD